MTDHYAEAMRLLAGEDLSQAPTVHALLALEAAIVDLAAEMRAANLINFYLHAGEDHIKRFPIKTEVYGYLRDATGEEYEGEATG